MQFRFINEDNPFSVIIQHQSRQEEEEFQLPRTQVIDFQTLRPWAGIKEVESPIFVRVRKVHRENTR